MKRYKVIADYPNSEYAVGRIYETDPLGGIVECNDEGRIRVDPEEYPHIFKELQWWEDVPAEELPKYVRWKEGYGSSGVVEVDHWAVYPTPDGDMGGAFDKRGHFIGGAFAFTPATASEYNEYLNRK